MRAGTVMVVVFLVVLAGCSGSDPAPVTASGSPATVPADAASAAGFEHVDTTELTLNRTITISVEGDIEGRTSRDVDATIPVATYRRSTDGGPAVLAVAASPSVEIIENPPESRDPLGELSTAELLTFVQSTYTEPADLSQTETRPVTMLGEEVDLVTYRGTAVRNGERVDVAVHVARAPHDGDVVTAVAVHPAGADERDRIADLLADIQH